MKRPNYEDVRKPYCQGCIYYAKSVGSCDYFIIEDKLRGCPGGEGCEKRILKKDVKKMQPKWDMAQGRQMWAEGKSDRQIAEHFGIAPGTVNYQRRKNWEKRLDSTPPEDKLDLSVSEEETIPGQAPASEGKEEGKEEAEPERASGPSMYEYYKQLQSFAEGLGRIQGVRMEEQEGQCRFCFEGIAGGGKPFRMEMRVG